MDGKPEAVINRDATPRTTPGLGWNEVSAELGEFFASIKLAMFLFIMLAMTATIGTVIQQSDRPEVYIKEYGEEAYRWFLRLGFTDVYHTWWFTSLLALLCINSLTCFYKRFPAIWRSMQQDKVNVALPFIKGMKHQTEIALQGSKEAVAEGMVRMLAEKGYRVLAKNEPHEATLYATKGVMGRVGAHMAHLSATVIVLGGLIGSTWGFQEFGVCLEGQTYHIPKGKFDLKIDKFWIDYHDNGAVKSYNSTLTVIDQGAPVTTKTITVNDPLVYKGIWFYQSSYGDSWDQVEVARVNIKDKTTDKVVGTVDLEWKKEKSLDNLGLKLALTDFVADFSFNSIEKTVYSKSVEHTNPAL
ncbi:MAG: cytochrome c biogenesis protein ResB [Nitrospirae bacterium]|nr:MAG: cytochrome c biogenesis protein ResB [Nitrospirota bacterium]